MLWARIVADGIVVVHASYVAFVGVGLAAILVGLARGWDWVRNPWFRVLHLVAIGIVAVQSLCGVRCPLTTLEDHFRRLGGQRLYPTDFIGYWTHRLIFVQAEPRVLTVFYVLFGLAVLGAFVLGPPRPIMQPTPVRRPQPTAAHLGRRLEQTR